jgi:uncharacterized metal-binding protein YceD (DUF177 family)|tara:strand:+ start:52 stop:582 length:531 start_codon:yes stop_codon:yes gene_type:complete
MEFDSFLISFDSLELGEYNYRFLLDDSFFKNLEYSEIQEGRVVVDAVMKKTERLLEWSLNFTGEVTIPCDRCGDDFSAEIDREESLVVKFAQEEDEDDGIIILKQAAYEFNISHYLFETINLNLPIRRIHPDKDGEPTCNPEVLSYFYDDQESASEEEDNDNIDPRWAALKKLNKN